MFRELPLPNGGLQKFLVKELDELLVAHELIGGRGAVRPARADERPTRAGGPSGVSAVFCKDRAE
jgi:hypothetical protein